LTNPFEKKIPAFQIPKNRRAAIFQPSNATNAGKAAQKKFANLQKSLAELEERLYS
jgi:hypothetical protein